MPDISGYKRDVVGAYIEKDPAATLDYTVDWSDWMPLSSNLNTAVFTTSTITGDTAPLTIDSTAVVNDLAVAVISGGTAGEIYTITNTITTDNSETDSRQFRIKVVKRQL